MGNLLSKFVRPEEIEPIRDTLQLSKEEKQRFFRGHRSETQIVTMEAMFCPVSWLQSDNPANKSSTKCSQRNSDKYASKSSRMGGSTDASAVGSTGDRSIGSPTPSISSGSTGVVTLAQLRSVLRSCSSLSSASLTASSSTIAATDGSVRPKDAVRRRRRSSSSD